jgi:hypothetical protein
VKAWALAVVLLAGCAAAPSGPVESAPSAGVPSPNSPADAQAAAQGGNGFLLDALRPPGNQVSDGAEPSILVDMLGRAIWIGDTSGLAVSFDNGTTWGSGASPFLLSADGWGLAQDATGTLYFSTTGLAWVDVARSTDLGRTAQLVGRFVDVAPIADRPWIAARGDGEVAMVFYAFGRVADEACARSLDGGETWLDRQPFAGAPNPGNLVYDDAGTLYFSDGGGEVYRLQDGCQSLQPEAPLMAAGFQMFPNVELGANNMLQVATAGNVLYSVAAGPGNRQMLLSGSKDGGTPRLLGVSPPQLASNTFGAVSTWGDEVAVAWYGSETAGDPSAEGYGGAFNVYVARVKDFWGDREVTYYRLTDEPNHVGDICMGGIGCSESADRDLLDYFGVDFDPWGGIHVAYGHDGAGSNAVVRYARIPPGFPGVALDLPAAVLDLPEPGTPPGPNPDGVSPTASFTAKARGYSVGVDGTASEDPQGSQLTYAWSWGDGATSTGPRANHTYARHGAFAITLTVTDPEGNVGRASRNLLVDGSGTQPPTPRIAVSPAEPVAGQTVTLRDASTDADGRVVSREWVVNGKTSGEATLQLRLAQGTHSVKLTVTDDVGVSASTALSLKVRPAPDLDGDGQPDPVQDDRGEPISIKVPGPGLPLAVAAAAAALAVAAARRRTRRP